MADTPAYVWGASRKDQNRIAHITHGNGAQVRGEGYTSEALRIGAANVTSLHSQIQCVWEFQCAVMLLQETRITDLNQAAMRVLLRRYSWGVLWGHGVPSAHTGGVAMLVKPEHSATQILPATTKGVAASRAGRLMIAAIALNRGNRVLYVFNVYGHSGCNHEEEREDLISTVFREAAALGDVAIAIGGDWNVEPQNSATVGRALGGSTWRDVGANFGVGSVPTFEGSRGSSRIDYWLVNSRAASFVEGVSVVGDSAIPSRKPVVLHLTMPGVPPKVTQYIRTHREQTAGPKPGKQMVTEYATRVLRDHSRTWARHALEQDVDKTWTLWRRTSESVSNYA